MKSNFFYINLWISFKNQDSNLLPMFTVQKFIIGIMALSAAAVFAVNAISFIEKEIPKRTIVYREPELLSMKVYDSDRDGAGEVIIITLKGAGKVPFNRIKLNSLVDGSYKSGISYGKFTWCNKSWNYRVRVTVDSGSYARENEIIEHRIDFTELLNSLGVYDAFDNNSIRVVEYYDNGTVKSESCEGEVFQFDKDLAYDKKNNAVGELIWVLKGYTPPNTKRIYYIYFDTEKNSKPPPNFSVNTNLKYNVLTGPEFVINVSNGNYTIFFNYSTNYTMVNVTNLRVSPSQLIGPRIRGAMEQGIYDGVNWIWTYDDQPMIGVIGKGPLRITVYKKTYLDGVVTPPSITPTIFVSPATREINSTNLSSTENKTFYVFVKNEINATINVTVSEDGDSENVVFPFNSTLILAPYQGYNMGYNVTKPITIPYTSYIIFTITTTTGSGIGVGQATMHTIKIE